MSISAMRAERRVLMRAVRKLRENYLDDDAAPNKWFECVPSDECSLNVEETDHAAADLAESAAWSSWFTHWGASSTASHKEGE